MKLDETGADGLVPISSLGNEYFRYDPDAQTLTGEKSRRVIGLGQRVTVRLQEAVPVTGGLLFELLAVEGRNMPTPRRTGSSGAPRRKLSQRRIKRSKERKRDERGRASKRRHPTRKVAKTGRLRYARCRAHLGEP